MVQVTANSQMLETITLIKKICQNINEAVFGAESAVGQTDRSLLGEIIIYCETFSLISRWKFEIMK